MPLFTKIYTRLFPECAANGLRPYECPGMVFVFLGILDMVLMVGTFFLGRRIASDELVLGIIFTLTVIILLVSYSVSSGLRRIAQARRSLEDERRKVATIVEELTDGLLFLSTECRIQLVNRKAEELLGIDEKRTVGRPRGEQLYQEYPVLRDILAWCPTLNDLEKNASLEVAEINMEIPVHRTLRVTTAGIKTAAGEVIGFIKVVHDMSREKELDEMKSEFLAVTSHQLRTPLSSVRWLIELLLKKRLGSLPKEQHEVLQKMEEMNLRMIALVDDLLGATRIEQGQMEYQFTRCRIDEIVRALADEIEPQVKARNLHLSVEIAKDLPEINGDANKLRLVVQNLIENALHYTPKGRVTVRVKSAETEKGILIEVEDTGSGLEEEERNKIFTKFYRGPRARKLEPEGTGLGLYLVSNIVQKHHGRLTVDSKKGEGSTFRVILPQIPSHSSDL